MKRKGSFFALWRRKQSVRPEDFQQEQTHPGESRKEQDSPPLARAENVNSRSRNMKEQENELKAMLMNFHVKENREAHKTDQDDYEIQKLMLRRGQAFDVTVKFNRDFNPEIDVVALQFVTGKNSYQNKQAVVRVETRDTLLLSKWGMQLKEANGNTVCLSVMSSAEASIGYYDVMVETKSKDSSGETCTSLYQCKNGEQICFMEDI